MVVTKVIIGILYMWKVGPHAEKVGHDAILSYRLMANCRVLC